MIARHWHELAAIPIIAAIMGAWAKVMVWIADNVDDEGETE